MNQCDHVSKVIEWGFDKNHDFKATLWGCTNCEATSKKPFKTIEAFVDHSNCDYEPCFGCKAKGLQLSTGDARGAVIASGSTNKKWDKELQAYRDARKQGIQPAGTTTAAVRKALEISDKTGKAYNANVSG